MRAAKGMQGGWDVQATASVKMESGNVARVDFEAKYCGTPGRWLFLQWWGNLVGPVSAEASRGKLNASHGRGRAVLGVLVTEPDITLRISYALRLTPAFTGDPRLLEFSQNNLPAIRDIKTSESVDSSRVVIDWVGQDEGPTALGALYYNQNEDGLPESGSRFLIHTGTSFRIYVGLVKPLAVNDGVTIAALQPSQITPEIRRVAEELAEMSAAVRRHFTALFGEAFVKHRDVVMFDTPDAPSRCLGSSILVNLSRFRTPPFSHDARVSVLDTLAHEYSHTWLYYGVAWRGGRVSWLLNEALALPLALDAVEQIGGASWSQLVIEKNLWGMIGNSLGRPIPPVGFDARLATSAGLVSEGIRQEHRETFLSVIRALRDKGRSTPLDVDILAKLLDQSTPFAGSALRQALERPRPLVARMRRISTSAEGSWVLAVRGSRRATAVLHRRLSFSEFGQAATVTGTQISWSGTGSRGLRELVQRLEPWYVVSRRRARSLLLKRHAITARLWYWARQTCLSTAQQAELKVASRVRLLVASVLALVLNPDDLLGYLGAARLSKDFSKRLARRFGIMAIARGDWRGAL